MIQKEMSKNPDKQNVLSKAALISVRSYAQEVSYPAGTTIVHQNDKGSAFYLILSGQVEIILAEGDRRLPMSRLKKGSSFGEISLFTQNPVFADVVTIADTRLLAIPSENFQDALAASAALRNHIFERLCSNLHRESLEIWNLFQYTQALSSLMHIQDGDEPIICESNSMAHIKKRLGELGDLSLPILITGETGTGKFFIAKKIHQHIAQQDEPLINLDCQQIDENQADKILFGSENTKEFIRRDSQQGSSNLLAKGALHLADKGSIILRHIDSLDLSTQKTLLLYLETLTKLDNIFPRVHVLATTNKNLMLLAKEGLFDGKLAEHFADNVLDIPPLRKRKHDILPLAKLFVMVDKSKSEGVTPCFTESAEHKLLSGHYQHSNVAELREAVELAASFAEDSKINAEHIFAGPKSHGASIECDVTRNNLIQRLIKRPTLWLLQGILLMTFSAIIILCFTLSDMLVGRIANTMVWAVWWPGLMILFLFVGRVWCTVCPISTVGRIARSMGSLKLNPPTWMKKNTAWIMAFLFLIIIGSEHIFHMTREPFATGILLLCLMSLPAFFCLIYQRETWCRYLCPLGSLAASYSISSTVQVHANPNVCAAECTTHECFKGSQTEPGCPVFHHPLYVRDAHLCKLCFTCLRSCPHRSAKLYLHTPLQNLWRLAELDRTLVSFTLVVFFLAIVMLSSHKLPWIANTGGFILSTGLAMVLAFFLHSWLSKLFANDQDHALTDRIAFGLVILAWGPFMAFHLDNIPGLNGIFIRASDGSIFNSIFNTADISLLLILQFAAVIFASVCTAICFWRIRVRHRSNNGKWGFWTWKFIFSLCAVYLLGAIALILYGGVVS